MADALKLTDLQGLIIDMDGVMYHGNDPIKGAKEFVSFLREFRIPFLFLTNNSTLNAKMYVDKLARMDIQVEEEEILTSAEATALYLQRVAGPGSRIYMVGEEGLRIELEKKGLQLVDSADVEYVVVGWDRQLTFDKLTKATLAIRAGAKFLGTNPDRTFPAEIGIIPGAGAIQAAIQAATEVEPLIIGKPELAIVESGLERLGVEKAKTGMLGDRLETDILAGVRMGMPTILVLSGVTPAARVAASPYKPDLVYPSVLEVAQAWRAEIMARTGKG